MDNQSKVTEQTGMTVTTKERSGAMAVEAAAARAKAEVEARYVIALRPENRRDINMVRRTILDSCNRPRFANGALYRKPVGGSQIIGFSIRFAEEAIKAMKNIVVDSMVVWDDDDKRNIRVTVTDLENNAVYSEDIILAKTVERKALKQGQEKLGERLNSYGDKVFIVAATEDELSNKTNAAKSKVIRNAALRLIPQDILEEARDVIEQTVRKGGEDPKAETKKICDNFAELNINPAELARYLGHSLETVSPAELLELRSVFTAIRDNETSWAEILESKGLTNRKAPVSAEERTEMAGSLAGSIDKAVIENPYEHLVKLAKDSGVTIEQIHSWMKDPKVKLAGEKTEELAQVRDDSLRVVITTWRDVVSKIKKVQV